MSKTEDSAPYARELFDALCTEVSLETLSKVSHLFERAVAAQREACAKMLDVTSADLLLMAGEMSGDELLTVKAVVAGFARKMRYKETPAVVSGRAAVGGGVPVSSANSPNAA